MRIKYHVHLFTGLRWRIFGLAKCSLCLFPLDSSVLGVYTRVVRLTLKLSVRALSSLSAHTRMTAMSFSSHCLLSQSLSSIREEIFKLSHKNTHNSTAWLAPCRETAEAWVHRRAGRGPGGAAEARESLRGKEAGRGPRACVVAAETRFAGDAPILISGIKRSRPRWFILHRILT